MQDRNVGGLDRLLRAVLAVALLVVAGRENRRGNRVLAEVAAVAASSLLFNVLTCFCAGNWLLGVDTTRGRPATARETAAGAPIA